MAHIIWSTPAFKVLETLLDNIAFGIVKRTDMLGKFPRMGQVMDGKGSSATTYRQLIFRKTYRIIYKFEEVTYDIHIVMIQNCKQRIPSRRDLDRIRPNGN